MKKNLNKTKQLRLGGKTLDQWSKSWRKLDGGFSVKHNVTYNKSGLYRAILDGRVMFVGYSKDLWKRLQQLRSKRELSTNRHYGARMIRQQGDKVQLEVLLFDSRLAAERLMTKLRSAMVRDQCPPWNVRRAFEMRGGKWPAK